MNIKNYLSILRLTELFDGFSTEELLNLFKTHNYIISKYNKGSIIHFESEKCNYWDIILKGQVFVQKIDEKGNVLTITEFNLSKPCIINTFPDSLFLSLQLLYFIFTTTNYGLNSFKIFSYFLTPFSSILTICTSNKLLSLFK